MSGLYRVSWKPGSKYSSHPITHRIGEALEAWRRAYPDDRSFEVLTSDPCGDWVHVRFNERHATRCPCEELAFHFAARGMNCETVNALGYATPHAHRRAVVAYA
jgi:hypothetical protein